MEIDDDAWQGRTVGPETKIRIDGEVDRDATSVTVDVERLTVIAGDEGRRGGFQSR